MDSARGFLANPGMYGTATDKTWILWMVEQGYEAWLVNSWGVKYSQKHERDGEWSLKEKWDFDWADMGYYDLPAAVEYILQVTQAPKVTVAAHSQGTSQMWYALAKRQDFFAKRVNRFIAMASCTIPNSYPGVPVDFENMVKLFLKAK